MIKNKHDLILDFINQFRNLGSENTFSNGMCYWFAEILRKRFADERCHIVIDQVANHFACEINDRIYDITGDITDNKNYHWDWFATLRIKDKRLSDRLYHDCVFKLPYDITVCGECKHIYIDDFGNCFACNKDKQPRTYNDICIYQ